MPDADIIAKIGRGVAALPAEEWDACNGAGNPFLSHAFLSAMEDSGSVGRGSGWTSAPIVIEDDAGAIAAALPAYLKSHSQGEYVFDQSWAHAFESAGGRYYPKLQIAAPFSPVPGPRLLLRDGTMLDEALRDARVTREEVRAAVRSSGIGALGDVAAVVLETDGSFSVIAGQPGAALSSLDGVK